MTLPWQTIRKDEWPVALTLAGLYCLIIASFTLTKIARDSLFLAVLPVEYIPYVYMAVAAVSIVVVAALARLDIRSHRRLLGLLLLLSGAALIAMVVLADVAPRVTPVVVYLWNGSVGTVMIAEFWLLANQRIDARRARRIFGPVGAAGVLGGLAAGAGATAFGALVESKGLLVAAAILSLAGIIGIRSRSLDIRSPTAPTRPDPAEEEDRSSPLGDRYVLMLVGLFLLVGVSGSVLDYAFKIVLQTRVTDEGRMAAALGALYSVQNVAALVTQLGLTGVILTRFGSRHAANVLPIGILAGTLIVIGLPAAGAAVAIVATRAFDAVMRTSLARTAWEFLYYPLDERIKQNAKRFIDVVVNRAGDAAAGALLLGLTFLFGGSLGQVAILLAVLTAVWLVLEFALNRGYAEEVTRSLERVAPRRAEKLVDLREVADESALSELLKDPDDARVRYAIELLEVLDPAVLGRHAGILLRHHDSSVRTRALAVLLAMGRDSGELEALLAANAPQAAAGNEVEPVFANTDEERVLAAARADDDPDPERAAGNLTAAMHDPHPDVRRIAYLAAGRSANPALLPTLVGRLAVNAERKNARDALVAMGPQVVGAIGDHLVADDTPPSSRRELAAVLAGIGTMDSAYSLYRATRVDNDLETVCMALAFLNKMRARDPGLALPETVLRDDLAMEIERYAHSALRHPSATSGWSEPLRDLFTRVLAERQALYLQSIFRRAALVSDPQEALNAHRGLTSTDKRVRAQAIEYLDTHLPRSLRERFIPLLDAGTLDERANQAAKILGTRTPDERTVVLGLLDNREPWLSACALFLIGSMKMSGFEEPVARLSESQDALLRDTAVWANRQLQEQREGGR